MYIAVIYYYMFKGILCLYRCSVYNDLRCASEEAVIYVYIIYIYIGTAHHYISMYIHDQRIIASVYLRKISSISLPSSSQHKYAYVYMCVYIIMKYQQSFGRGKPTARASYKTSPLPTVIILLATHTHTHTKPPSSLKRSYFHRA